MEEMLPEEKPVLPHESPATQFHTARYMDVVTAHAVFWSSSLGAARSSLQAMFSLRFSHTQEN